MSTISLRLPDSLHKSVRKLAKEDNISIKALHRTIQSGTCFAKKAAKTCHFKLPVSKALCLKRKQHFFTYYR